MSTLRADDPAERSEIDPLAAELAHAYGRMVRFYRDQLEMSGSEADARAQGRDYTAEEAAADLARIRDRPPDEVSWFDLNRIADRDPEALAELWSALKSAARRELASGHRTARALDWQGRPWDRARFLAIRDSFRVDDEARPGIETALVDLAAEAFSDYLTQSEHLHMLEGTDVESTRRRVERDGDWAPMRLSYADAIAQATTRAERAHQRFLRTLKMLHEWRRSTTTLYVGSAAQINVGEQQVNVAATSGARGHRRQDLPKLSATRRARPNRSTVPEAVEEN